VKTKYGIGKYLVELYDFETKKVYYESSSYNILPDFLTGRKAKTKKYKDDYYTILFSHFKNNLDNSRALIVIGYGFKDTVINDVIIKNFDFNQKPVVIIDTKKPTFFHDLNDSSKFVCSSVVDVNYEKDILPILYT